LPVDLLDGVRRSPETGGTIDVAVEREDTGHPVESIDGGSLSLDSDYMGTNAVVRRPHTGARPGGHQQVLALDVDRRHEARLDHETGRQPRQWPVRATALDVFVAHVRDHDDVWVTASVEIVRHSQEHRPPS
jgi:hypothetical protein